MQNYKKHYLIALCTTVLATTLFIYSCRKKDLSANEAQDKSFNVAEAKEWWYGTFKKTAAFNFLDETSPYVQISRGLLSQNASGVKLQAKTRYPSWKGGVAFKIGSIEMVELPLVYDTKMVIVPKSFGINESQYEKVAEAALYKLLLVKKAGGNIIRRVVTFIPTYKYALEHNFDISQKMKIQNIDKKFEGIILVRDWNEKAVKSWRISKGSIHSFDLKPKGSFIQNANVTNSNEPGDCWEEEEIIGYTQTCISAHNGDEPNRCDNPENWEDGAPIYGMVEHCRPDDGDEEGETDPYQQCMLTNGNDEQCMCQIYGICGDGGGGEGEVPYIQKTPCELADSLANSSSYKSLFNALKSTTNQNKEYAYFYTHGPSGIFETTLLIGPEGAKGIGLTVDPNAKIEGYLHSHYTGLLSVFSPDDIYTMAYLYMHDNMTNPLGFTAGVVTANGTQYILKIDDLAKFAAFANNLVTNSTLDLYSHAFTKAFKISPGNSNAENEKAFLHYLQINKTGLKLFKGNTAFDNWQPKKIDSNNNVVNNPC